MAVYFVLHGNSAAKGWFGQVLPCLRPCPTQSGTMLQEVDNFKNTEYEFMQKARTAGFRDRFRWQAGRFLCRPAA